MSHPLGNGEESGPLPNDYAVAEFPRLDAVAEMPHLGVSPLGLCPPRGTWDEALKYPADPRGRGWQQELFEWAI
jgi:hypothetical protein